ncbi:outer membrane chaperone Skp (OmpH) [Pseudopedobacter saltans DSM 12145]|uniref:Outer membrane chaperone Skp (OmpH) n=1 Tax=Pseudopedobacter saltans (strain ATCC 51119 / DSM 12145 / JCM 21818 / CCUG 39354 / LMG 10337 / NBRC 100064 / NCIMB 13643) TaxID=762903 RepID=F0S9U9_PSESL|nr:OmpH family outer membrane protein [Pseudopedobacter saltans]ADY52507.1 outer membrane chaperone Skp (OmpH) [Pseudopedobacter saltans DSM 12145]
MKKSIILFALIVIANVALAQRLAYVDSEYILKHIPEYASAQKQLNELSIQWQKDIEQKFKDVEGMQKAYQADKVLLTDDMRKRREEEIGQKQTEANELQQKKFGYEGDLFKEKVRLIKPVQERIAKAIQEYAARESLDVILDKATVTFLYARPNYDRSNDIITRMGYKPGTFAK